MKNHYYHKGELVAGQRLLLEDSEGHHLTRVVRIGAGEEIAVVNGTGGKARATVIATKKGGAEIELLSVEQVSAPAVALYLVQALPKAPRLDFIIEKTTELGATKIILFPGEKSERRSLSEQQWLRCHNITISAMKQCGRLYLPELVWWPSIKKWPEYSCRGYFGDVAPTAPWLLDAWKSPHSNEAIAFCIGPEAGLSANEEALLRAKGWLGVKLHNNILRTDTAPLVALSLLASLSHSQSLS